MTDLHTTWVETQAVMGKSQERVRQALETITEALPFALRGIDLDNGSEFINAHLYRYCRRYAIQFTRSRPYKKDDNAHIEQKNWTHVRKLVGYDRYDSPAALAALNALYADLRLLQNLWLPSVKLVTKTRVGSRLRRVYGPAETPLDRVRACPTADAAKVAALTRPAAPLGPLLVTAPPSASPGRSGARRRDAAQHRARRRCYFVYERPDGRRDALHSGRDFTDRDRLDGPRAMWGQVTFACRIEEPGPQSPWPIQRNH